MIAIQTAKNLGYYTILCDFLPDNPGQKYADKFYLESTTDLEKILEIAQKEEIDGILAYASDPAAPTAAFVAEKLGLPGNPYESVQILCNKDRFRSFLSQNNFFTPAAKSYESTAAAISDLERGRFKLPVIVKPVDSSGSKGVGKINNLNTAMEKLSDAMDHSRSGRIIVEEYVNKLGYQIAGDGLSIDGDLVFRCFANDHFDAKSYNPFVPVSASFPYNMPQDIQNKIHNEIQRLLTLLKMKTCTYNFDIRIDDSYNVYLMEVAPRDGGNYIQQILNYATGIDLVKYTVLAAMGEPLEKVSMNQANGYYSYYAVHSLNDGILREIEISPNARDKIIENHLIVQPGDEVEHFSGANTALGCLLMKFENMEEMLDMMDYSRQWIKVVLEEDYK